MQDQFGRAIEYLRLSVTDRCNLRCRYCMPEDGLEWLPRHEVLTFEEIEPRLSPPLTVSEVEWVLRRRDKVIAHLDDLIAVHGDLEPAESLANPAKGLHCLSHDGPSL